MAFAYHLIGRVEKRRIQKLNQHPETEVIPLVRCGGKQQDVPSVRIQSLSQLEILGLANSVAVSGRCQMMSLIENHQVPWRCVLEPLYSLRPLQGIDTSDQPVVLCECVRFPVGHVAFASEDLEVQMENLIQFAVPVI